MDPFKDDYSTESIPTAVEPVSEINAGEANAEPAPEPLPIATSGELNLMPPSTGLPVASSSISQAFSSIPRAPEPEPIQDRTATEAPLHG